MDAKKLRMSHNGLKPWITLLLSDEHSSTINRRRQEAGSYQARAAGPPSLASRPTARPVQAVSADIQGSAWTGTVVYIADLCRPVTTDGSRQRLRSATRGDLVVVSSSVTHFGTRAFAVAGPKAWNQLPMHIRARESVGSFKMALKSHFHFVD